MSLHKCGIWLVQIYHIKQETKLFYCPLYQSLNKEQSFLGYNNTLSQILFHEIHTELIAERCSEASMSVMAML
jgi:hypothetical protein